MAIMKELPDTMRSITVQPPYPKLLSNKPNTGTSKRMMFQKEHGAVHQQAPHGRWSPARADQ